MDLGLSVPVINCLLDTLIHTWASRSIRMNCESLPSAMIGETVPDPDRELRSVVRSTQDPENEVGVSDMSLLEHCTLKYDV